MANKAIKQQLWLIHLLSDQKRLYDKTLADKEGMSFKEIDDAWTREEGLNPKGAHYPLRTFHNHINAIQDLFGIVIYYGYHGWAIYLSKDWEGSRDQEDYDNMASRVRALDVLPDRIITESVPTSESFNRDFRRIVHAMKAGKQLLFRYKKYNEQEDAKPRFVAPYCLKLFHRRWYLLGKEKNVGKLKVFALDDRMTKLEESDRDFALPRSFDAKEYFQGSIGIIAGETETVRIKAYGTEKNYWDSVPMHPSQKLLSRTRDYAIYELTLATKTSDGKPNWELLQALLARMDRIEILSPASLRQEFIKYLDKTRARYK